MTQRTTAKTLLAQSLGLAEDSIDAQTTLGNCPQWDSLAHFRLILGIEEQLGRKLNPMETVSVTSLDTVIALIATD